MIPVAFLPLRDGGGFPAPDPSPAPGRADRSRRQRGLCRRSGVPGRPLPHASALLSAGAGVHGGEAVPW